MSIEITHVRFSSLPQTHETLSEFQYVNGGKVESRTKAILVDWIDNDGGIAYVGSGANRVRVGVEKPAGRTPYLRTYADGEWRNNLVNLPTF